MNKNTYNQIQDRYINTLNRLRLVMIFCETKIGKYKPSDDEINEMVEYFIEKEEYEFCEYLRKYKETKNNSLGNVAQ